MKFAEKALAFVGCLTVWILLSCGSSIKQRTTQNEKTVPQSNLEKIAEIGKAATVQIGSLSVEGPPALGSGFFIRPGLIATNIHVVNQHSFDGAVSVVKLVNKPTWYTIEGVMASDPKRDLVVLKVAKEGGEDPHILSLGDSDIVKASDSIVAIGNPRQGNRFVQGDVSKGLITRCTPYFFSMKAENIREGYSGGPVLNVHGDVIGITVRGDTETGTGTGYAIPANYLQTLLKNLPTQAKPLEKWREEPLIRYYSAVDAEIRGELVNAIKGYDTAIRLAPDFADAYLNRGDTRKKLGDLEGAIKDYDTAIRLGADYAFAYLNRGVVRYDSDDYTGAIEDFNTVIRLKPEDAVVSLAYINRGNAKSDLDDYTGAIEDFNTAIRLKPSITILAAAYVNRGIARSDLGNNKGAIEDCNTAIHLKPANIVVAAAYNIRGEAKAAQWHTEDSLIDYNKAIQLKPDYTEAYYNRGVANATLGYTAEAETDLKTALKLLEETVDISQSADKAVHLSVRPDLKADIEKALRDLE